MAQTVQTTNVVISFSGVLHALYHHRIVASELDGALFYFGCTRDHFIDNGVGGDRGEMPSDFRKDPQGVEAAYRTLLAAVLAAEADGRAIWRELSDRPSWAHLNELLASNGLPAIDSAESEERSFIGYGQLYSDSYSYPGVVEAVKEQKLPFRVIWNS